METSSETEVCIVGAGPAGMMLGYLLGRCGIETLVLESQDDFDRDFRGDTLHAGVMEIFDSLGLAERILELPHYKIKTVGAGGFDLVDFSWLKTDFPFVTMMAQSIFLDFLAKESASFESFHLEMGAKVRELIRDKDSGEISGVRYRKHSEYTNVKAQLVVACDGRGSRVRKEAALTPEPITDPMEVLWFRLPKMKSDGPHIRSGALTGGRLPLVLLERPDHYQIAAIIAPGGFSKIRKEGLPSFHRRIQEASPELFDRAVVAIDEWKKVAFLHVEGSRLKQWHAPGLLLIGDAAHVMTPIGGVGINYAIWDAIEAANVLVPAFKSGDEISLDLLSEIQQRREPATKKMQSIQRFAGRRILNIVASDESKRARIPLIARIILRFPMIRTILPRIIALGGKRTHCEIEEFFAD